MHDNFAADNAASCLSCSSQIYQCTTTYNILIILYVRLKIASIAFVAVVCVCLSLIDFSLVMQHKIFHFPCCKPAPLVFRFFALANLCCCA